MTSQVTKRHLAKAGARGPARRHQSRIVQPLAGPRRRARHPRTRPPTSTPGSATPARSRFSAYVQDKAEYDDFIVNAGLRFDYFNSRGQTPADPRDPNVFNPPRDINIYRDVNGDGEIDGADAIDGVDQNGTASSPSPTPARPRWRNGSPYWYEDADAKLQFSPRLGVAYPITAQGVLHFSYGLFLQIPTYEFLFAQPGYRVGATSGLYGTYGNPNIDPQRTSMYEIGVKQGIGDDLLIDVTAFYRDVRDWVRGRLPGPGRRGRASTTCSTPTSTTRTCAASRSSLSRSALPRASRSTSTTRSRWPRAPTPAPTRPLPRARAAPSRALLLIPLDWDQRHTFNANAFVGGGGWGVSSIVRVGTGYPYTPAPSVAQETATPTYPANAERRPWTSEVDLYAFRDFEVGPVRPRLYFQVYNLFDVRNADRSTATPAGRTSPSAGPA